MARNKQIGSGIETKERESLCVRAYSMSSERRGGRRAAIVGAIYTELTKPVTSCLCTRHHHCPDGAAARTSLCRRVLLPDEEVKEEGGGGLLES